MIKSLSLAVLFGSCSLIPKAVESYPHDNAIEEFAEDYVEEKTGVSLDFTPCSEENKKK